MPRPSAEFAERACYNALATLGVHERYGLGSFPISGGFFGWIGISIGTHPTYLRLNPNIGVHNADVEKVLAATRNEKYQSGRSATFAIPLGVAAPHVSQFIVHSELDLNAEVARLTDVIRQYGIPYINSISSYRALLPLLYRRIEQLGGVPERYAIALHLSGDTKGALEFLDKEVFKFQTEGLIQLAQTLTDIKRRISVGVQ